jgi:protein-disulfide isomerase
MAKMRRLGLAGVLIVLWFSGDALAQGRRLEDGKIYRVPVGTAPIRGPSKAKVTIVEFSDFQCPFCSRAQATVTEIRRRYPKDVRIVFRQMPLPFHEDAMRAAQASLAAAAQGKFWDMHDAMFADPRALDRAALGKLAARVGLDVARFSRELDGARYASAVLKDVEVGEKLGVTGTPTFFVNGRPIKGALPLETFTRLIDDEIRRANAVLARGVSLDRLYDELVKNGLVEAAKGAGGAQEPRGPDPSATHAIPIGSSPVRGKSTAKVTIVEFADFQCSFCTRAQPVLDRIRKDYGDDVRIVFKHQPLDFHPDAMPASEAAAYAAAHGKFWEMHDILYANQSELHRDHLEKYGAMAGLDVVRFRLALDLSRQAEVVLADLELGDKLRVTGTPTFFVNGRLIVGAQPYETFKRVIDEEKKRAEALLAKGTPATRLYEELVGLDAGAEAAATIAVAKEPPAEVDYTMAALLACEQGDAEAAKRAWIKLKGSRRTMVGKDCKALGVDLTAK